LPWNHLHKPSPTKVSTGLDSPRPPSSFFPCPRLPPTPGAPAITSAGRARRTVRPPPLPLFEGGEDGFLANTPCPFPFLPEHPLSIPLSLSSKLNPKPLKYSPN
jgi:hypothetical protein